MTSLLQGLSIRSRVWIIVGFCLIGLLVTATIAVKKAQTQYKALKEERYVSLANVAVNAINYYYQSYLRGEITRNEARDRAKKLVNEIKLDNRTYFYLYSLKHFFLIGHPFVRPESIFPDNTPEEIDASLKKDQFDKTEMGSQLGLGRPAIGTIDILVEQHPETFTGFINYYYYPDPDTKYPVVRRMNETDLPEYAELKTSYGAYFEPWEWVVLIGVYREDELESFYDWLYSMLIIISCVVFTIYFIALAISNSIAKPLQAIAAFTADLSQGTGDLSKRLIVAGHNELTEFARGFNGFAEKIAHIVTRVTETNTDILKHSNTVTELMHNTVESSNSQLLETEMLASATNELSYSLKSVADQAEASSAATKAAEEAANQAVNSMTANISSIHELSETLVTTETDVADLEVYSNKVSSVLEVITGISEQTNLLALNAAIEAARAGDQGRGFAVVADEVRTLAMRTQTSAAEIQLIIENLQKGTKQVVSAVKKGLENSESCNQGANITNDAMDVLMTNIEKITKLNLEIASAVVQQSNTTSEIASSSQKIADSSRKTQAAMEENQNINQQLNVDLSELNALVQQFKV